MPLGRKVRAACIRQRCFLGQQIGGDDGIVIVRNLVIGNKIRFRFKRIIVAQGSFCNFLNRHGILEAEIPVFIPGHQLLTVFPIKPGQDIGNRCHVTVEIVDIFDQFGGTGVFAVKSSPLFDFAFFILCEDITAVVPPTQKCICDFAGRVRLGKILQIFGVALLFIHTNQCLRVSGVHHLHEPAPGGRVGRIILGNGVDQHPAVFIEPEIIHILQNSRSFLNGAFPFRLFQKRQLNNAQFIGLPQFFRQRLDEQLFRAEGWFRRRFSNDFCCCFRDSFDFRRSSYFRDSGAPTSAQQQGVD